MKQSLFLKQPLLTLMKIAIYPCILITLCTVMAFARPTKAQQILSREVSIKLANVSLKTVLQEIEKQTNVRFVYSNNTVEANKNVSLLANNEPLTSVLPKLLYPNKLRYEVVEEQIVLKKNKEQSAIITEEKESLSVIIEDRVSGKVTTEKGEVLPGVSVLVKGSPRGTVTNNDGEFNIAAKEGDVLVLTFVGFEKQEVKISASNLNMTVVMKEDISQLGEVVVIGSRSTVARTNVERPVPVDVISAKELQTTGQTELGQQVQFMSPSFNSAKNGINGVANYADPASLKGLSPDQMLVLVDGKRRHQFAALNSNVTVGKGTVVTDLNSVPSLALERMEILRDGAAAQYGSDAIAGIANLVLKKSVNNGTAQIQYGVTSKGDGGGYTIGLNYGFDLGKKASLNITGSYQDVKGTDRSDPYNPQPVTGGTYTGIYTNVAATDQALLKSRGVWGNGTYGSFHPTSYGSNAMKSTQVFYNLDVPLTKEWTLYSFGGFSQKDVFAQAFLRTALATSATSNPDLFPDGYVPQLPGTSVDLSGFVGVKRKTSTGWNWDISTGYGKNYLDQNANNTSNASMGANSPKDFYIGRIGFGQSLTEVNLSKTTLGLWGTKSVNVALGAQYRVDNFTLTPGDDAASLVGPLSATKNKTPGSQGRVGIDKADLTNKNRSNIGMYLDLESDITNRLLVAGALRYENYSDFGSNVSGKLATRLKLTDDFSIRGSINKGFRAPLLQQIANAATTSTVQSGVIRSTKQLPSDDARLAKIGIEDPKPETSWNYNLGVTAKLGANFLLTVDAYKIDITDRIIVTENLNVNNIAALKANFAGFQEITFFTNAINTGTKGIDVVASYKQSIGAKSKLTASLALTVNKTEITGVKATPTALQLDTKNPILLIDTVSRALIETSQPHSKVLVSVGYQVGKFAFNLRSSYFGAVTGWEKLSKPVAGTSNLHQSQTFGGKNLFDASVVYSLNKFLTITIGGNNITDVYPDKVYSNYASYANGQVPYTRNANQFGFNGSYYYGNLTFKF
ncbi:TonB-dependent receptor [Arcicella sp. LKC2W]|uniref:TonB-dependent receptor domain-containing protein n=1 Tax=Arcicella sp. LKC2W TaxID=2984198 RepID=UPI002B215AC1|nr:TonB-dependent receptor [Arcicella sp. LKC2W]MEA5458839.1 TonB-dependent receptor [Arcicella sp. LKC2W]